jgi:uncharacterized Zn finger protein (UPF0148 family)
MSFEQLQNILKENKEREESLTEDEDLANNQCPYDYWPLDVNSKGERSCPICGRIYK